MPPLAAERLVPTIKYIDLFCGIGGFRIAMSTVCRERKIDSTCVFSSDIDRDAQQAYQANFGETPQGDITKISAAEIPTHDLLFAGFPCQPFSILGDRKGFNEARGTLFFDIARILEHHRPRAFVLENVKQLVGHNQGETLNSILEVLKDLGYHTYHRVLNALHFGLPQKRERVFIVGFREPIDFTWANGSVNMQPLAEILEQDVPTSYYASEKIRTNRLAKYAGKNYNEPTIWHENKGGHISAYPYSCALRAGASYNYLLVNGNRRLTEREMLRLQGFPDDFKIVCSYSSTRKQAGNSVAVPCVAAVIRSVFNALDAAKQQTYTPQQEFYQPSLEFDLRLSEKAASYSSMKP